MVRQYRYIDFRDRANRYLNEGPRAAGLGVTTATVYRELKRGETENLTATSGGNTNTFLQQVQENFKRRGKPAAAI